MFARILSKDVFSPTGNYCTNETKDSIKNRNALKWRCTALNPNQTESQPKTVQVLNLKIANDVVPLFDFNKNRNSFAPFVAHKNKLISQTKELKSLCGNDCLEQTINFIRQKYTFLASDSKEQREGVWIDCKSVLINECLQLKSSGRTF